MAESDFGESVAAAAAVSYKCSQCSVALDVDELRRNMSEANATGCCFSELLDEYSANSPYAHPLCENCCKLVTEDLSKELLLTEKLCESYEKYLAKLTVEEGGETAGEEEMSELLKEEAELDAELEVLRLQDEQLNAELESQKSETNQLREDLGSKQGEYSHIRCEVSELNHILQSLKNQQAFSNKQLNDLKRTSTLNIAFHIWHSGQFGTINDLRLGWVTTEPVPWTEINAACGQVCLLLCCLAEKVDFVFERYSLHPKGSFSYVTCIDSKKTYPLYAQGGRGWIWDPKFDTSMVAFLDCLKQLKENVIEKVGGVLLPYAISADCTHLIDGDGQYSIKLQLNSPEHWTKAMKLMLTNLKWALSWVSSQK